MKSQAGVLSTKKDISPMSQVNGQRIAAVIAKIIWLSVAALKLAGELLFILFHEESETDEYSGQ